MLMTDTQLAIPEPLRKSPCSFLLSFYLLYKHSGRDEQRGADTEHAGSTCHGKDAAQTVVVMETETNQQNHHDEGDGMCHPSSLDVCHFYSTSDVVSCQEDTEGKDDRTCITEIVELGQKIACQTSQPSRFVKVGGYMILRHQKQLILLLIEQVIGIAELEEYKTCDGSQYI